MTGLFFGDEDVVRCVGCGLPDTAKSFRSSGKSVITVCGAEVFAHAKCEHSVLPALKTHQQACPKCLSAKSVENFLNTPEGKAFMSDPDGEE